MSDDLYCDYVVALAAENIAREHYAAALRASADAIAVPRRPVDLTRETTIAWVVLHEQEDRAADVAEAAGREYQRAGTARLRAWERWVASLGGANV